MAAARAVSRAAALLAALAPGAPAVIHRTVHADAADGDLAFMHVPYNFGHTIEKVAMFPAGTSRMSVGMFMFEVLGGFGDNTVPTMKKDTMWQRVNGKTKKGGVAWGHFNPDLSAVVPETGCSLYFSPQKYWPKDVAQSYFGNKTIFGVLRDPFERLVAMFRGQNQLKAMRSDYGTLFKQEYVDKCDVNNGIKDALKTFIAGANKFQSACTFLPQAEFFEGEFGITLPVDARLIPGSINTVFQEHGYSEQISAADVFHVSGCSDVWAGDLDAETRGLVKQVYKADLELLCKHFGYCDAEENTCIHGVAKMCPQSQCAGGKCTTAD